MKVKALKKIQTIIPEALHKRIERIAEQRGSTVRNVAAHAISKAIEAGDEIFSDVPPDGRQGAVKNAAP